MARATRGNETLAARIRHKFRLKNTTGYSLNALVDFEDPIDVLAHLMMYSRLNAWGRQREVPEAPPSTFRQWYLKNRAKR